MKISAVVSAIQGCALLATFTLASMFPQVVQSRHSLSTVPTLSHGETPRVLSSKTKTTNDLQHLIDSYYAGDGFPKAGRSLQQKIQEADAFLTAEIAKTGSVGVGVAVVYNDQTVLVKGYGLRKLGDPATAVKANDMFEIGSVTKTFIALAIGLLVEDGKLQWLDPVKKHLSWLRLVDNYAEEYVRIGDLLSMNSGFGRLADFAMNTGAYNSSRDLVEALVSLEPDHPLRETPAYANINFAILGELIEEVSGQSWVQFLDNRIWKPLGMSHTFGATEDVPDNLKGALNKGHMTCRNTTLGPFEFDGSLKIEISPRIPHSADGSMVSSPSDMAKFLRLILNKGVVDGIRLLEDRTPCSRAAH